MQQFVRVSRWLALVLLLAPVAAGQGFNVDFGDPVGHPGPGFGAAADQPGVWNVVDLGTNPLVDLAGAATGVTLTLDTSTTGEHPSPGTSDTARLIDDNSLVCVDPDEWSFAFAGLTDGVYEVFLYAPAHPAVGTGAMVVDGDAVAELPGAPEPLVEGENWVRVVATVGDGTLEVRGSSGAFNCTGVAGVQLRLAAGGPPPEPCVIGTCDESSTAMCLESGRFRVSAEFDPPNDGDVDLAPANAEQLTADSGYFWFFQPANIEVVTKVIRGCPVNEHYWVFAGGLTDVHTVVRVCDTATGVERTYVNPQETAFQPVQDTAALETCP